VLGPDHQTVTLATTPLSEGLYTLTINNIEDYWSNVVPADTAETFTYTDVLYAHWKLDETEGTTAHDRAGTNDANLIGDPIWQPDGGVIDGALLLDGIDDYIDTPLFLDVGAPFGIFAWVKGGGGNQVIVDNWLRTAHVTGNLVTALGTIRLYSETPVIDGQWHRVGVVGDPRTGTRVLYVDDVEVARDTQEAEYWAYESGFTLTIGAIKSWGGTPRYFWSGMIDDVKIYDRRDSE
jgi:hypothetical protein